MPPTERPSAAPDEAGPRSGGSTRSSDSARSGNSARSSNSTRSAGSARSTGAARAADAGRSATRPASARRAAATDSARRTTPPGGRRGGRATALGLVLLALMLAYAYPVRLYLTQQAEIARLELNQAEQRAAIAHLQDESAKWNDPAYIIAQARARFQMVEPGTKAYLVLPVPTIGSGHGNTRQQPSTFYGTLWSSLRAADNPAGS